MHLCRRGSIRVIVTAPSVPPAKPLWARFYEIGSNRPIFCGRDGIIKYSLAEIEHERRIGYNWYTSAPAELLAKDYPAMGKAIGHRSTERLSILHLSF